MEDERLITTCANDHFSVGGTSGSRIEGFELHISRIFKVKTEECARRHMFLTDQGSHFTTMVNVVRQLFPDRHSAWQWAFEHGYIHRYFTSPDLRARRVAKATDPRIEQMRYDEELERRSRDGYIHTINNAGFRQ